jgi:hypothetical protein
VFSSSKFLIKIIGNKKLSSVLKECATFILVGDENINSHAFSRAVAGEI